MSDSPCQLCHEWPVVHTDSHLANVCMPAKIRVARAERDAALVQGEQMKKWCCSSCGLYMANDPRFNKAFTEFEDTKAKKESAHG